MNTVGLAVIGSTGVIGRVHIDAIAQLNSCRLVGINARTQQPLQRQAADLGVIPYPTLDDTLSDPDVDAIVIATPHRSHAEITEKAAGAGKHVLVEKPMSVTLSEADRMIQVCRDAGVKLGVLFNNRFRPEALKVRELVQQGAIGEIYRVSMSSAMIRSQDYYDRLSWRGKWQAEGGGALLNQGIHSIDLMQWVGGLPTGVMGIVSTRSHDIEVEDFATAAMTYEGGGHGTLHCSTSQAPNHQRLELWGNEGAIIMDDWTVTLHNLETAVDDFINHDRSPTYGSPGSTTETFTFEPVGGTHVPAIDDFVRAIIEDREPAITGEDGLRSQEIVAAVTLSGCRNKQVDVPVNRAEYDALLTELVSSRRLPS